MARPTRIERGRAYEAYTFVARRFIARSDAESCQTRSIAALARRRLAELHGNPPRTAAADDELRALSVVDPARFARVFATWPG